MQRVALDLCSALEENPLVETRPIVLRTSWASTHRRVPAFLWKTYRRLTRAVKNNEVDAVLFSSMVTAMLSIPLRKRYRRSKIPLCVIVHGLDVTTSFLPYQWLVKKVFKSVDMVFPVSSATAEACTDRGLESGKLTVVPNGIAKERFATEIDRPAARVRLAELMKVESLDGYKIICSVGRQVQRKGFDWFILNVLPSLDPRARYVLAGDGPMAAEIAAASNEPSIEGRVHVLGRVSESDLQAIYAGSDIYVMPNVPVPGDIEGFGVVMLEAGLSSLPVVAANLEGIADVIEPEKNGILIESEDSDGFIRTINRLLEHPDELDKLSASSRESVLRRFRWSNVADTYVKAIATLVARYTGS